MSGWFRVERGVWGHDFFPDERMSKREAWLWMVAAAAWEDTTHRVGGKVEPVERGTFFTTLRCLKDAFRWDSDTKVRRFLKDLEEASMIKRETRGAGNAVKTHVTICNYETFQSSERGENEQITQKASGKKRTKETNITNNNNIAPDVASDFDQNSFDDFIKAYPQKSYTQSKVAKAFSQCVASGVSTDQIIRDAKTYAEEQKGNEPRYIKNHENWLASLRSTPAKQEVKPLTPEQKLEVAAKNIKSGKRFMCTDIAATSAGILIQQNRVTLDECRIVGVPHHIN